MNNRIIKESADKEQYQQIKAMSKRGYHAVGFDNQGFVMAQIVNNWLHKVRVLRHGRVQRYRITEPTVMEKQLYT